MAQNFGGWSETEDTTEETQKICDQVRGEVEKKTGENYGVYTAVKYRYMLLCGAAHYVIKVHVGGEDYIHLTVFQVTGVVHQVPPSLKEVEQQKSKDDSLEPSTY